MKPNILIALFFMVAAATAGCSPRLYPSREVVISDRIIDTLVHIEPDSALLRAVVSIGETGGLVIKRVETARPSQRVQLSLQVVNDSTIAAKAVVDSMGIYMKLKERHKEETVTQIVERKVYVDKEVNVLSWWQKVLVWLGFAMLVTVAIWIVRIVIKLRTNGIQTIFKQLLNN